MKSFKIWQKKFKKVNFSWQEKSLLLAPILIWFSYQPNIHIGRAEGMNLEFSLPMIYIVIFWLISLPLIYKNRQKLIKNKIILLVIGFTLWNVLSIFWATNLSRAILTAGVWFVLALNILAITSLNIKKLWPFLKDILVFMASIVSVLAIIQVIYGTWIDWGLCAGCLARGFGFVRPSVFAIEPQFLGSLLLAPIIIQFNSFFKRQVSKHDYLSLFLMMTALYLTLSRGAIFALAAGLIFYIIVEFLSDHKTFRYNFLVVFLVTVVSFGSGLIIHAAFTELNPRVTDGFYDSVSKSINQLSLGIIKLPEKTVKTVVEPITEIEPVIEEDINPETPQEALFDGYVERSTDERTNLTNLALETWQKDLPTIIFGVGVGGSGRAIYEYTQKTGWEFEIVQNQYLEVLLETGLVGFGLFIATLIMLFARSRDYKIIWAILVSFMVQWFFFSGLPNALHIYLIIALCFGAINSTINDRSLKLPYKNDF